MQIHLILPYTHGMPTACFNIVFPNLFAAHFILYSPTCLRHTLYCILQLLYGRLNIVFPSLFAACLISWTLHSHPDRDAMCVEQQREFIACRRYAMCTCLFIQFIVIISGHPARFEAQANIAHAVLGDLSPGIVIIVIQRKDLAFEYFI